MSSSVSYEFLMSKLGGSESGFTSEGGYYETFINDTGAASVKGTVVVASSAVDNAVSVAPADSFMPIGAVYENGIANGSPVKVVVSGKAQVLLKNSTPAVHGYWCGASDVAGRMVQQATVPSATEHFREIGHSLESKTAGTNVLALIQMHFL